MASSEELTIVPRLMAGCRDGKHNECKREYRRWLIHEKTNKVVYLDELAVCSCTKRGCPCYIKPADRTKPKKATKTRRKN